MLLFAASNVVVSNGIWVYKLEINCDFLDEGRGALIHLLHLSRPWRLRDMHPYYWNSGIKTLRRRIVLDAELTRYSEKLNNPASTSRDT